MDKQYWKEFYSNKNVSSDASTFAIFCSENYITPNHTTLVDLGCGNGRDSFYLNERLRVTAIDQCVAAVTAQQHDNPPLAAIIEGNFVTWDFEPTDIFYSRFTLHSITETDETNLLLNTFDTLGSGGILAIEARTTNDEIYWRGEHVHGTTWVYNGHSRRFIEVEKFIDKCKNIGYSVEYAIEASGLSVYGDSDPTLLRLILIKK